MTSDEIRERYLSFFEERGHLRIPSASLVPFAHDPSALLTVAGMHPLKPYFLGEEAPPERRLTSCQKVFRTVDIDNVGNTARHLTFFEMLGNFSFGDYFKREAIEYAWELSRDVFGFEQSDIWVTVFAGDEELGLGPDEEAIACWQAVGVPRERIVQCPRSENFWQAGPTGPCGPCSELYIDRGVEAGAADDLPGGDNERFLEYWNLVFMQYDQQPASQDGASELKPLPANNIDTGLGLNRLAAILQDKPSVFETDQFKPLIELGEELSGIRYGEGFETDRSLRILADHARAMTFLVADGVVPSNEDRGYVLRRVMRRAIQHGRSLQLEPGFLPRYGECVRELMGGVYPELIEQAQAIDKWLSAEEESFGRTLTQGLSTLRLHIEQARDARRATVPAAEVFRLHDTYGFPYEMTRELLGRDVFRLGEDQALAVVVEDGALHEGEQVVAVVDHRARHATECNHTATHLLQAALRERLGSHVRQAGSYVGPDKLRFDFSHSAALTAQELRDVEDQVNEWIARNDPVRPMITTLDEAKRLGAMALFGEKYGEVVRMVEVGSGEHSRELCGGTHVRSTAEIGVFHVLAETSS